MQMNIFLILKESKKHVSAQEIANSLNVTVGTVKKRIDLMRTEGYNIEYLQNKGYVLVDSPKIIKKEEIKYNLNTEILGKKIIVLDSIGSTNDYGKELGLKGRNEGALIAARKQTKGKGRFQKRWISTKDKGVYFTILLEPNLAPAEISSITPIAGLIVAKSLNKLYNLNSKIKWPNDIIINNKKICGILTEIIAEINLVQLVILGIGINCDNKSFPDEVSKIATSVYLETGITVNKSELVAEILNNLEKELINDNYKFTTLKLKEYKSLCATIGRPVTFYRGNNCKNGIAVDVSQNGELIVMLNDGNTYHVNSGEVTVQGIY